MAEHRDESGPLTTACSWQIRPGSEAEFEAWIREFTAAASAFPGYERNEVISPGANFGEYMVIVGFDTYPHLCGWQESDTCSGLLKKAESFRGRELLVSRRLAPLFGRQPQALQAIFLAAGMIMLFAWLIMPVLVQIPRP